MKNIENILANTTDSIWAFDKDYRCIYLNKAFIVGFKNTFGVELKEGDNILKQLPEGLYSAWKDRYELALNGQSFSFEESFPDKNNNTTYIEVALSPITSDTEITGVTCFGKNITQNKLNEIELKKNSLLLNASLESQKDTILLSIDKNYNYMFFNSAHYEVMKFAYDEKIEVDTNILDYITDSDDRNAAVQNYSKALNGESHSNVRIYGDINKEYYESFFNPIRNDADEIIGATALARNITARIKQEEALRASELSLKEANITKDKFFSIIAHDLKAPFNSLLGFSEILVDEVQQNNFENISRYVHYIHEVSNQSYALLNNLLDWSLSQTGGMKFNPEKINFNALSNELLDYFSNIAQNKKVVINSTICDKLELYADRNMLTTIIRNLVSNAIKYTPEGGEVTISATTLLNETKISVMDTGVGIEAKKLEKLFKIEESLSTPGTQNEKGTGLGLILCHDFVKKHKGKIWAESEVGNGSIFSFTIPSISLLS